MSNNYFEFRQFVVRQERCAMKVGTDGCLLGAWAQGGRRILDVGTGTGLIALMMAQRFPQSAVTAIDVDADAVSQARENVGASPFGNRIEVLQADFSNQVPPLWEGVRGRPPFDCIVSNPPYFMDALTCPDNQRTLARHATSLTYDVLMQHAFRCLSDDGELSVVVPFDSLSRMESAAALAGLLLSRCCAVRTTERKPPRRYLLAFRKHLVYDAQRSTLLIGSPEYQAMMHDFYLKI